MTKATVDEHAALIRELISPALAVAPETVDLDAAAGRVTTEAVLSPVDLPLFRNSQMDGFAVHASDVPGSVVIVGAIAAAAGMPPPLEPGTTVRIMTGAVVPEGADAVVPVEDATTHWTMMSTALPRTPGEFVRERGSDLRAGSELLPSGQLLASRHLAALAAAGLDRVDVRSRVKVAIITTGSEVIAPGSTPEPGQIFDSNATALAAAVNAAGAVVAYRTHVRDDAGLMLSALEEAASAADLIVTSGGISMGDYEVVREVLEPLGARVTTIAMQPGGPQATAVFKGVPVVCFPGNPVSTQLSFELFVAPLLRAAAGLPGALMEDRVLVADAKSVPGKRQFLRGRALPGGLVELVSGASSHLVAALAASDLLVDVPLEITTLTAGDVVRTWAL